MRNKAKFLIASAGISTMGLVSTSLGQTVSYATAGSTYAQNFDSLGGSSQTNNSTMTWTDGTTLQGWYSLLQTGSSAVTILVDDGTVASTDKIADLGFNSNSTSGNYANPGSPPGTNRALGSQPNSNDAANIYYAVALTNNTGQTLTNFSLAYVAELWRTASTATGFDPSYTVQYQLFSAGTESTDISAATGWVNTGVNSGFSGVANTTGYVDGTSSANQDSVSGTVTGISWGVGQELWIRWSDNVLDGSGNKTNQLLGIDNVSVSTAVPEPVATTGLVLIGLAAYQRRRQIRPSSEGH